MGESTEEEDEDEIGREQLSSFTSASKDDKSLVEELPSAEVFSGKDSRRAVASTGEM